MKTRFCNPFSSLYNRNNIADKRLRKDLNLFAGAFSLGMVFISISTGTPFSGLAVALGANDLFYALMFAVPIGTSFFQFFASWLLERTRRRKAIFVVSGILHRALWIPVAMVPLFVPMSAPQLRLWAVMALVTLSSIGSAFVTVSFFSWLGDVVPMAVRGRYLGLRSSIATVLGLFSAFAASLMLDAVPGLTGYMLVFGVGALFGVADIVTVIWINDPPMRVEEHPSFAKMVGSAWRDRDFRNYLLFWTAWIFSWNVAGPFYSKYCISNLNLGISVTTVTGQVAYGLLAFFFIAWWGRKLDSHSYRWVLRRCGILSSILPVVWLFATPGSFWPNLLFSLGNGVFVSGVDLTSVQMLVTVTPQRNRSMFVAMYMVATSVAGASLGYLVGSGLLQWMDGLSFPLLGLSIDKYKLLFVGAGALRLLVILFLLPMIAHKNHGADPTVIRNEEQRSDPDANQEPA